MSQDYEILIRINETMDCTLKWLKFLGFEKLRKIFDENFKEDFEYQLYDQSDGKKSTRKLAEKLPISHNTVTNFWDKWVELGIMEKVSVKSGGSRGKRIFSLSELGIDIPE